jgi:cytochrome b subunit of formate dehydrogenase
MNKPKKKSENKVKKEEELKPYQEVIRSSFWILLFTLITLKLTGIIVWSWWWITAPIWVPICLIMAIILIMSWGN